MFRVRIAVVVVGVVAALAVLPGVSSAANWSIKPSPNAPGTDGYLSGESCVPAGTCIAVGASHDRTDALVTLAESRSASGWSILSTPNPAGAAGSSLSAVACSAATACTAVGDYTKSSGAQAPVAERYNGSSWSLQATPALAEASLAGVSCPTSADCTAVGEYTNSAHTQVTLAEHWDGTSWSVQTINNPSGAKAGSLSAVSCTTASDCTAVGQYTNSGGTQLALAEHYNGSSWSIQTTPDPTGASFTTLSGVSCVSSTCTAVGNYVSSDRNTLAERYNGTSWSIQSTPNPSGSNFYNELLSVSCVSPTACTAVGGYDNSHGTLVPLAERSSGTSWSIQTTPDPSVNGGFFDPPQSPLSAVSCASGTSCTAIGYYTKIAGARFTLTESWNGTSWAIGSTLNPPGVLPSSLSAVSCSAADACTAVGDSTNTANTGVPLAERWNGSSWAIQSTPSLSAGGSLAGVTCPTAADCTAVGEYTNSAHAQETLAEHWNGSSWAIQSTPPPSGAKASSFSAVSCRSATACTAVGQYTNSAGTTVTLAERYNGTGWMIQTTVDPSGASSSVLSGVSCASSTACTASGYYNNGSTTAAMAESWNGSNWTLETVPEPSAATAGYLFGVSCTGPSGCTATGYYSTAANPDLGLVERWSGTNWTRQATPDPGGAAIDLHGVSCASATSCTSVGTSSSTGAMAVGWNGTSWTIQTTPNPAPPAFSDLAGVSCTSSSACSAVGYDLGAPDNFATLAESYS